MFWPVLLNRLISELHQGFSDTSYHPRFSHISKWKISFLLREGNLNKYAYKIQFNSVNAKKASFLNEIALTLEEIKSIKY